LSQIVYRGGSGRGGRVVGERLGGVLSRDRKEKGRREGEREREMREGEREKGKNTWFR
jgi:hypothetical protein